MVDDHEEISNFRDLGLTSSPEVYGATLGTELIGSINEKLMKVNIDVETSIAAL